MTREMIIEQLERHRTEFAHDHGWNTSVLESLDAAIKVLKQEYCEDAISRQAVIEQTYNWSQDEFLRTTNAFDHLRRKIKALPSVQQTVCIAKISFDDQQMKEMMDKAISNLDFSDLISRQAAIDELVRWGAIPEYNEAEKNILACCIGMLSTLPPVQPQPKMGRWIESHIPESTLCECSVCGFSCGAYSFNFCPNCGCRMAGGRNKE